MNMILRVSNPDAQDLCRRNSLMQMDDSDFNHLAGALQVTKCHLQNSARVAQSLPSLRGEVHSITGRNPVQPFGSMPRCCSSLRMMRLSQADRVSSPSSFIACNMASSNAGSTRKAICLFPLGILMFDMCLTLGLILVLSCNVYHVSDTCKVRSPVSAGNTSGPLTKPLSEVTAMADQQLNSSAATNTNTFLWRFLALSSIGCNVVHIPANTEREAREQSPDGCVMVFAGRLPAQEVRHA